MRRSSVPLARHSAFFLATPASSGGYRSSSALPRGSYAEADVRAVVGGGSGQGPVRGGPGFRRCVLTITTGRRSSSPKRAGMLVLPELLTRLRRIQSGRPMAPASVRSVLKRLERAAMQSELPAARDRKCPRCGSSRVDTRRTTVFATNYYEQHCEACGHIEEWDEGVALGEAMTEARRK